jgi:hypothetical protein
MIIFFKNFTNIENTYYKDLDLSIEDVFKLIEYSDSYRDLYPGYYTENEYEEHYMYDSKEKAYNVVGEILEFFNSLDNPIPIFRVLEVNSKKDIDYSYLGESWSFSKKSAIEFSNRNLIKANVLLSALVYKKDVNWKQTLRAFFLFSDLYGSENEDEITIENVSEIFDVKTEFIGKIEESKNFDTSTCPYIKVSQEIIDEVNKFDTIEQLLKAGGISIEALDRASFGFCEEDIKTLMPKELHIKWKDDYENVLYAQQKSGLSKIQYAKTINLSEPIDVSYEKDKFWIEDGHHRYYAAKILNKPLKVNLEIKQNAIVKLCDDLDYDDFHKCIFNQVKNKSINEGYLQDMMAFGLNKDDIDSDGYVTLYHGGKELPKRLKEDEIFFMISDEETAKDYAKIRNGKVFTIKVRPEDVSWNHGSYEVEFDKGGIIRNGKIIPKTESKKYLVKSYDRIKKSFYKYETIDDELFKWIERTIKEYIKKMSYKEAIDKLESDIDYLSDLDDDDLIFVEFAECSKYTDYNLLHKDLRILSNITFDEVFEEN